MRLAAVGVGPQRTGSSWLWECLRRHPALCFPAAVKETHFLDERFERGWAWYAAHFAHRRVDQRCVEISATYFDVPAAAERLHAHAPDCRVIVTLRDPAARAFSVCYLRRGELVAVETVNHVRDQMAARKLIPARARPDPAKLADDTVALKDTV